MSTVTINLKTLFLYILLSFFSTLTWSNSHADNDFYVSLKSGYFSSTFIDGSSPVGLQFEYKLNRYFAMEVDYLRGDLDYRGINFSAETIAGYASFRTTNTTYFLLKLGVLQLNHSLKIPSSQDQNAIDVSYGVGAGVVINSLVSIESEYTILNDDLDYIGIALRFGF
jgi:hypothetical protein